MWMSAVFKCENLRIFFTWIYLILFRGLCAFFPLVLKVSVQCKKSVKSLKFQSLTFGSLGVYFFCFVGAACLRERDQVQFFKGTTCAKSVFRITVYITHWNLCTYTNVCECETQCVCIYVCDDRNYALWILCYFPAIAISQY